jgi:hypothetical protein
LAIGTDESFERAKDIYMKGAYMGPYATLQLEVPLRETIEQVAILGMNENKRVVYGKLHKGTKGSATLLVDYSYSDQKYEDEDVDSSVVESSSPCAVGGHSAPQTEGCK